MAFLMVASENGLRMPAATSKIEPVRGVVGVEVQNANVIWIIQGRALLLRH